MKHDILITIDTDEYPSVTVHGKSGKDHVSFRTGADFESDRDTYNDLVGSRPDSPHVVVVKLNSAPSRPVRVPAYPEGITVLSHVGLYDVIEFAPGKLGPGFNCAVYGIGYRGGTTPLCYRDAYISREEASSNAEVLSTEPDDKSLKDWHPRYPKCVRF